MIMIMIMMIMILVNDNDDNDNDNDDNDFSQLTITKEFPHRDLVNEDLKLYGKLKRM